MSASYPGNGGSLLQPRFAKKSLEGGAREAQEGWEGLQGLGLGRSHSLYHKP